MAQPSPTARRARLLIAAAVLGLSGCAAQPAISPDGSSVAASSGSASSGSASSGSASSASSSSGSASDGAPGTATPVERTGGARPGSARAALAGLEVKGRAPRTGYDRDLFGSGWGDPDRNGCDARNDILARDLAGETFKPGTRECVVATGTLADPYSGHTIAFVRGQGTSDEVQIDHVVAVSDAWQKGAQSWDAGKRVAFYNDPMNLLAVDGPLNMQKGDGDAATWLPPDRGYRCAYVARQIAVKTSYALWVTAAERAAMVGILDGCPGQELPGGGLVHVPETSTAAPSPRSRPTTPAPAPAPKPAPKPAPATAPKPAAAPVAVSYANCSEVRAAGAAPIHRGEPGYAGHLDRDDDGIGCE